MPAPVTTDNVESPGNATGAQVAAAPAEPAAIRILVCGEPARGDDAAGPLAVEAVLAALPDELAARLDVRACGGPDPVELLDQPPGQPCLVVDAVVGVEPGEVITLPLESIGAGPASMRPASTHTMSLPETLELAATVRGFPVTGWLVGLGGARFALGEPLSAPVAAALPRFEAAIRDAIERLVRH